MAIVVVALLGAIITNCEACPPWSTTYSNAEDNNSTHCKCGSELDGVVDCNNKTLQIINCYCMTYNEGFNMTLVGHCTVNCIYIGARWQMVTSQVPQMLNQEFCQIYNREGQLCGNCMKGCGPPVYSYSYQCVECHRAELKWNLLKYITVAFVPLTVFYVIVIMLKVRATASFMVAYVMLCQLQTAPFLTRRWITKASTLKYIKVSVAIGGIWNLDIFRSMYPPFCIHPEMTTLQVLALDYLIGVYPLVLIIVNYIAVKLHDRYSLVVRLWRPVNRLCMCIRQEWDIRGSLVQAFATFLVLSYVKILNVSFDLLTPVSLWTPEGKHLNQSYLYNAGETPYFGREHLPYGVLAVVMLTVFNILPVILLFLYPCSWFQKCLNFFHLNTQALRTFMDAFQGCYHHKPKERRYFAAIFLVIRILQVAFFTLIRDSTFVSITAFCILILTIGISILKPYKERHQNLIDVVVLTMYALYLFTNVVGEYSNLIESWSTSRYKENCFAILIGLFFAFFYACICSKIILPAKLLRWIIGKLKACKEDSKEEIFPHRLENKSEYSPLLA